MTPEESKDQDMDKATAALLRAVKRARKLAQQTGTAIVVMRDGKLVREIPGNDNQDMATQQSA
jgi:hypothetical protein